MPIDKPPERLRHLFRPHGFARLAWPADRDLVIARILQEGDDRANVWLYRDPTSCPFSAAYAPWRAAAAWGSPTGGYPRWPKGRRGWMGGPAVQ